MNINLESIKKRCCLFLFMLFVGGISWGFYYASVPDITDLIESRSIVYFFWGSFCLLLMFPVGFFFVLCIAYVTFTKSMQPPKFFDRAFTIGIHVAGVGFVIGNILSFAL